MYFDILIDFVQGLKNSIQFSLLYRIISENLKLKKLMFKLCKWNLTLYFLPQLILSIISYFVDIPYDSICNFIFYPITIISALIHMIIYFDLINIICFYSKKTYHPLAIIDMISLVITMTLYKQAIFISTAIINLLMYDNLYLLALIVNFIILSIYHSFYCYNALWQYKKINLLYIIDMHEKLWPYYIGYGIIPTILYFYTDQLYITGIYNIYMAILISLPFLLEIKYPVKISNYPKINLSIFTHITGVIYYITRYILMLLRITNG